MACDPGCWNFGRCYCGARETASFALGMVSIVVVACSNIPPLIRNFRAHASPAFSPWLLLLWLVADISNIVGAVLSCLAATQIAWAALVTGILVVVILQHFYYNTRQTYRFGRSAADSQSKLATELAQAGNGWAVAVNSSVDEEKHKRYSLDSDDMPAALPSTATPLHTKDEALEPAAQQAQRAEEGAAGVLPHLAPTGMLSMLLLLSAPLRCLADSGAESGSCGTARSIVGQVLGWGVPVCNLPAVGFQILHNARRQSTLGLSMPMFAMRMGSKFFYLLSVVLGGTSWEHYRANLPWLVDAGAQSVLLGVVCLQCLRWGDPRALHRSFSMHHGTFVYLQN